MVKYKPFPQIGCPRGKYEAEIINVEVAESSDGSPQLRLDVLPDPVSVGREMVIKERITLSKAADWKTREFLRSLGLKIVEGEFTDIDETKLPGQKVLIEIEPQTINGKDYPAIKKWLPPEGPQPVSDPSQAETIK